MLPDELTVTGRRVRVPVPLLFSRHHSPAAVYLYSVLDVLGGKQRGPVTASRRWLAGRIGLSESGTAKCLGKLTKAHTSDDPAVPDAPVFLVSKVRGCQLTAARTTLPGVPYIDLPEWSIGDDTTGPLVSALAWRLYAAYMWLRCPKRGTVAHARRDLAALLRVRADRIPSLVRELEAAGLITTHARPGRESLVMPLCRSVTPAQASRLWAAVLTPAEQAVSDAQRCADRTAAAEAAGTPPPQVEDVAAARRAGQPACGKPRQPDPSEGTSPDPREGTAPPPSSGTPTKEPHYGGPHHLDPARVRAAAPFGAATPGDPVPDSSAEPKLTGLAAFRAARERLAAQRQAARSQPERPRIDWDALGAPGCGWDDPAVREAHCSALLSTAPLAVVA